MVEPTAAVELTEAEADFLISSVESLMPPDFPLIGRDVDGELKVLKDKLLRVLKKVRDNG